MLTRSGHVEVGPDAAKRLAVLRDMDPQVWEGLMRQLPQLVERYSSDESLAALSDLLTQIAIEAPLCSRALVDRLEGLPPTADIPTLRRWAYFGLQRHRHDDAARLRHFEIAEPAAFGRAASEEGALPWNRRRVVLAHYLTGFDAPGVRVDQHDPVATRATLQRPTLKADLLLFPRHYEDHSVTRRDLLYRAAAAHAAAHLKFSSRSRPAGNRQPMLLFVMGLLEDARVERLMAKACPGLRSVWGIFHTATPAQAGFEFEGLCARLARALHDPAYADPNVWVQRGRGLFDGAAVDLLDQAAFDRVARLLAADIERMRLKFVPARHRIEPLYRDDNALLWDFHDAPSDEDRAVVHEKYEMDESQATQPPPTVPLATVDSRRLTHYPEWDFRSDTLHEHWTTVVETAAPEARASESARAAMPPHRRVRPARRDRIPDRSIRLRRLEEGDELDLDAAVDGMVLRRSPRGPDPRIFSRHGRRGSSLAVLLLMDLSASTDRFVPGSFVTVLQAEKEAAALLTGSLDPARDSMAVHGFASNGRQEVRYLHVKDFDEPLGPVQFARMEALQSGLSTRMGAALRHAAAILEQENAEQKLILLLTDGEPSDIDVAEDDYLREDARHAVNSAATRGIRTFCLTLDRRADPYVQRIFGARNYLIADRVDVLTRQVGHVLVKLVTH